jgi:hypothetical protein
VSKDGGLVDNTPHHTIKQEGKWQVGFWMFVTAGRLLMPFD